MTIRIREAPDGGLDYCAVVRKNEPPVLFYQLPPGAPLPSPRDVARAMDADVQRLAEKMKSIAAKVPRWALYAASPGLEADVAAAKRKAGR